MSYITVAKLNQESLVYRVKTNNGFEYYIAPVNHLRGLVKHSPPERHRIQISSFRQQITKPPKRLTYLTFDVARILFN